MCCLEFSKKIVPFAITFALGLFVAGIFNSFFASNKVVDYRFESTSKSSHHSKSKCRYDRSQEAANVIEDDVIFLVPAPPMPPSPPIAPEFDDITLQPLDIDETEVTVFPPKPPETITLSKEIKKSNSK